MKKVCKKWHVLLIVFCMLVTMMPCSVFADETSEIPQASSPTGNEPSTGDPANPGTPAGDPANPETPPDATSPPAIPDPVIPPDSTSPPAIPDPVTPQDSTSPPAIPDPVIPPDSTSPPAISDPATPPDSTSQPAIQMLVEPLSSNGKIVIEKKIVNDPGTKETFTFEIWRVQCGPDQYVTSTSISGAGTATVEGLSQGNYKVKEVDVPTNYTADSDEEDAYIGFLKNSDKVTFTNTYTVRKITIEKKIEQGIPGLKDKFTFEIWRDKPHGPDQYVTSASIVGEGSTVIEGLPEGTYKVLESAIPTYVAEKSYFTVDLNGSRYSDKVIFTNKYKLRTITINKLVSGDPASPSTFTFEIWRDQPGTDQFVTRASIVGQDTVIIKDLSSGDYKVKEVSIPQYYSADVTEQTVPLKNGSHHKSVTFTNTYNGPGTGSIKIIKNISSKGDAPVTEFAFDITGPDYSTTVAITADVSGSAIIENLKPGEYVVTEREKANFHPEDLDYDKPATVTAGSEYPVTFTNIYDPESTRPLILKDVAKCDSKGVPLTEFVTNLPVTGLNQSVIYRIRVNGGEVQTLTKTPVVLSDSYNRIGTSSDITLGLLYWNGEDYETPDGFFAGETYYYIDKLTTKGTYTNTIYLGKWLNEFIPYASSQAIVVVNDSDPGDGDDGNNDPDVDGGGGGGSHHYNYQVIYNPNFPGITTTGGIVPVDNNHYSYNNIVNVMGNTGDLRAENYIFKGWNTKPDGTGTMYQSGSSFNITADTTLYAIWEIASNETVQQTQTDTAPQPADGSTTVQSNELDNVPKTGDSTPLLLIFLLSIMSIVSIGLFGRKKAFNANK